MSTITSVRRAIGWYVLVPPADHTIQFYQGGIISASFRFEIIWRSAVLRVPNFMSAILTHPSGHKQVFCNGDHYLGLPIGSYTVQFVRMAQQTTPIPPVQGKSQDAWDVALELEIVWRVIRPGRVIHSQHLIHTLVSTCRAVVTDFIRSLPHDNLIQVPGETQAISEEEITRSLRVNLKQRKIFDGLEILDIILVNRQGDQRRTEVVQNAIVEAKTIETELSLERQKTQLAVQKLEQDLALIHQRRTIDLAQAQTDRLVAEENDQKRLRMAEIDAEEARLRRSVQEQEIEFQQIENAQQLEFQEAMKALEVKGEVFKQFGRAVVDTVMVPGAALGLNGNSKAGILEVMNMMIGSLNTNTRLMNNETEKPRSHAEPSEEGDDMQVSPPTEDKYPVLRFNLIKEIVLACQTIHGMRIEALEPLPSGKLRVKYIYARYSIVVDCGDGDSVHPTAVTIHKNGRMRQLNLQQWDGMNGLVGVLQAISKRINSTKSPTQAALECSETTWPQPAA